MGQMIRKAGPKNKSSIVNWGKSLGVLTYNSSLNFGYSSLLHWPSRDDIWRDWLESLVLLNISDDHQNWADDYKSFRRPGVFE